MIDIGDISLKIEGGLKGRLKGDWVVMNRQPTLHWPSIMGFQVVPQDSKTLKISLAVIKPLMQTLMEMKLTFTFLKISWRQQR